jgi:hypothetical protein
MDPMSAQASKRSRKRLWAGLSLGLLVLVLLVLVLLPEIIRSGIKRWYIEQGAEKISIRDVDFNPFTGRLVVKRVRVERGGSVLLRLKQASMRVDWWPLWKRRLRISAISLSGLELHAVERKDGSYRVAAISLSPAVNSDRKKTKTVKGKEWGVAVESLQVSDSAIILHRRNIATRLDITSLKLANLNSWNTEREMTLDASGSLDKGKFSIQGTGRPFQATRRFRMSLRFEGLSLSRLNRQFETDVLLGKGLLSINGVLSLGLTGKGAPLFEYKGKLQVSQLDASYADLRAGLSELRWAGRIYNSNSEKLMPAANGRLVADGLSIIDRKKELELLRAKKVDLSSLVASSVTDIKAAGLTVNALSLLREATVQGRKKAGQSIKALSHIDVVRIDKLVHKKGSPWHISKVDVRNMQVNLVRRKDRKWVLVHRLLPAGKNMVRKAVPAKQPGNGDVAKVVSLPSLKIDSLTISPGSRFSFLDNAVKPAYRMQLDFTSFSIKHVDSSKPESPLALEFKGKSGKYTTVSISGKAYPFSSSGKINARIRIREFSLPTISPYAIAAMGYSFSSGQLNTDTRLKIVNGKIDSTSKLLLSNLAVLQADKEKSESFHQQVSMPLEAALSMLRDSKNNIRLKLPVTGSIHDPKFSMAGLVSIAIGNAIKLSAVSYLKYTMQPYGTAITLFQLAGKALNSVRLQPVYFTAGQATLSTKARAYLGKVSGLMKKRPHLKIKLCGRVTNADYQSIRERVAKEKQSALGRSKKSPASVDDMLIKLATERSKAIKAYLVKQSGISSARLFVCQPERDKEDAAKARVDLVI